MSIIDLRASPALKPSAIVVTVPYRGATAEEVSSRITRRIEESLVTLDGIERVTSNAAHGIGTIVAHLQPTADIGEMFDDVIWSMQRLEDFPPPFADRPEVSLASPWSRVLTIAVTSATLDSLELRNVADEVHSALAALPSVFRVSAFGAPDRQLHIEANEETLRQHGLSLPDIVTAVRDTSTNVAAGRLVTPAGGVLMRIHAKREQAAELEDIVVAVKVDGTTLHLGDVATVRQGFEDAGLAIEVDGQPAVLLHVEGAANQNKSRLAQDAGDIVAAYTVDSSADVFVLEDASADLSKRYGAVASYVVIGLGLSLLFLALLFDLRFAVWLTIGMATSVLGAVVLLALLETTVHAVVLGTLIASLILVAPVLIAVTENIASLREAGHSAVHAVSLAMRRVSRPIVFGIPAAATLFIPVLFLNGVVGKTLAMTPIVIAAVLALALVLAFCVLPVLFLREGNWSRYPLSSYRSKTAAALTRFEEGVFGRIVKTTTDRPWWTLAIVAVLLVLLAWIAPVPSSELARVYERNHLQADLTMPVGTPIETTRSAAMRLVATAPGAASNDNSPFMHTLVVVGGYYDDSEGGHASHRASVLRWLPDRTDHVAELESLWRNNMGSLEGVEEIFYSTQRTESEVVLSHQDADMLTAAAQELMDAYNSSPQSPYVASSLTTGKRIYDMELTNIGVAAGLTPSELGAQLRGRFHGVELQRLQRGPDEISIIVRYPENRRISIDELANERILLAPTGTSSGAGGQGMSANNDIAGKNTMQTQKSRGASLATVARVVQSQAPPEFSRVDGLPAVSLVATTQNQAEARNMQSAIHNETVPKLLARWPGLNVEFPAERQFDMQFALGYITPLAMLLTFLLVATQMRSYVMPAISLGGLAFGTAGAFVGHTLLGYDFGATSAIGLLIVVGIAVMDSMLLVERYRELRDDPNVSSIEAMAGAVRQRFLPVVTTAGLTVAVTFPLLAGGAEIGADLLPMLVSLFIGVPLASLGVLLLAPALLLLGNGLLNRLPSIGNSATPQGSLAQREEP